jgi:hypothetical protein
MVRISRIVTLDRLVRRIELSTMDDKAQLLRCIDEDRSGIVEFLCDFIRTKSPNPPGDTTLAAEHGLDEPTRKRSGHGSR